MTDRLLDIPIHQVSPNPHQLRTEFDETELQELAATINKHGLIQRIIVTSDGEDHFTLLAGERRWLATQIAGLETIPAIVCECVDEQIQAEIALIENIQRKNLSAAEEARAYEGLATQHNLSNEQIAQRVGKDRATIANLRGLLRLPESVLSLIGEGEGHLSQGSARQLAQVAKFPKAHKDIEHLARKIVKGQIDFDELADDIDGIIDHYAREITFDWDMHWPTTPLEVKDDLGAFSIGACAVCPHFATLHQQRYCAAENGRCYFAKADEYARLEIERVSKAAHIPVARPEEDVTPLIIEFRDEARVRSWLTGKTRPEHLRLVRLIDQPADRQNSLRTYSGNLLLKSQEVLLASTDPAALRKAETVPVKTSGETPAQKEKREAAEERVRAERRAEKAQKRRAQHDIDWLGQNTARLVAPQITAEGATLEWLAAYIQDHSPIGPWPAQRTRADELEKLIEQGKGKQREPLLKESILVHLIGHQIAASYDVDWHEDWDGAQIGVKELVTEKSDDIASVGLGLRLQKDWNKPPVHHTEANCWHCGQFASMDHLTKRDMEEGWQAVWKGSDLLDVICPECTHKSTVRPTRKTVKK